VRFGIGNLHLRSGAVSVTFSILEQKVIHEFRLFGDFETSLRRWYLVPPRWLGPLFLRYRFGHYDGCATKCICIVAAVYSKVYGYGDGYFVGYVNFL